MILHNFFFLLNAKRVYVCHKNKISDKRFIYLTKYKYYINKQKKV